MLDTEFDSTSEKPIILSEDALLGSGVLRFYETRLRLSPPQRALTLDPTWVRFSTSTR